MQFQPFVRPRFRLLGALLLVLLGYMTVTACDWTDFLRDTESLTPKESQQYSQFGVTAQLPGTGWSIAPLSDLNPGLDKGEIVISDNKVVVFAVERRSMSMDDFYLNLLLESYVDSYRSAEYMDTPSTTSTFFHNHKALRVEGVRGNVNLSELAEDYKFIQYFFVVRSDIYVVGTGVKLSKWDDSTQALAESILESVTLP